jgi:hypothetical protein
MASNPPQALRLTLAYEGAQIRITHSERVAMIVPAVTTAQPQADQTGYWLEVHDDAGRVIYHRPLHQPIAIDAEAFSTDRAQSITRVPVPARAGQFTVLIPDAPDARTFELHGPADPARPDVAAGTLVRADVDALRKLRPPTAPSRPGGTPPPPSTPTGGGTS